MSVHKVVEVFPDVPRTFTRRQGDWAQEGGNNAIIVLGTDRAKAGPATIDDGLGTIEAEGQGYKAGAILAAVGRKDPNGNPDQDRDDAFIYLAMKTKADENLGTTFESNDTGPAAIVKSDHVRFVFRKNLKISATEKATHAFLDGDHLHVNIQGKVRVDLDVSDQGSSAQIDVQGNTITIRDDGSITIQSSNRVVVNTQTAEVHAASSALVQSPQVIIDSPDTRMTGKLTVAGESHLNGGTATPVLGTGGIVAAPGQGASVPSSATGMKVNGHVEVNGDVNVSEDVVAAGKSLDKHTHLVGGFKGGDEVRTTNPPT